MGLSLETHTYAVSRLVMVNIEDIPAGNNQRVSQPLSSPNCIFFKKYYEVSQIYSKMLDVLAPNDVTQSNPLTSMPFHSCHFSLTPSAI